MAAKAWLVDDEPNERFPIYTRGNVGEVFPEVVSPLTWSAFSHGTEAGWRDAYREFGVLLDSDFGEEPMGILGCFGGYAYLNLSYIRVLAVRTPGLTVADMDRQFFGDSEAPAYQAHQGDKSPLASMRIARTLLATLRAKTLPRLDADKRVVAEWVRGLPDPATAQDHELIGTIEDYRPLFRRLFQTHILTTFQASIGPGLLAKICAGALGDPTLPNRLLAGIGDVESAAPSAALWELGRAVTADPAVGALFDGGLADLEDRLNRDAAASGFRQQLASFLDEFGSRGPNEWELGSDTWGVRPALALAAIDCMRGADPDHSPRVQQARLQRERLEATAEARGRLKGLARRQFDLALRSSQVFSQGRERSKTTVIRATHGVRLRLRELARRASARGGPEALRDICLLTLDELPEYVADPKPWLGVIDARRSRMDQLAGLIPPFVFDGTQPHPDSWARRDAPSTPAESGTELGGIAGCPGVARGRAWVVLDPGDPRGIGPGEVLVAPITDPSWTPLFVPAEAVVVDVGAEMSHAVIVSRELGIPAVVSVTDATRRIPDGALIEVDGTKGTVRILEA